MGRITLEQLRTFSSVVRTGGIVKAAKELRLTQPAVTARIKTLEAVIGAPLLERSREGTRPTRRGALLLQHLDGLERLANKMEEDLVNPGGAEGILRIGVCENVGLTWLTDWLSQIESTFCQVNITVRIDEPVRLLSAMLARELDVTVLPDPGDNANIKSLPLPPMELGWYCSSADKRADSSLSEASKLFGLPVMAHWPNSRAYKTLRSEVARRADVPIFTSSSYATTAQIVSGGRAVCALPRMVAERFVQTGHLMEFDPGWTLPNADSVVCYLDEPGSFVTEMAAAIGCRVAVAHISAEAQSSPVARSTMAMPLPD